MFKKVLVANRGEIAVRILRTLRKLGISSVAVYSDADANALHVRSADEAVHIGGSRPVDSYLNVPALLQALASTGAEAVHPGYGLLSEEPEFAAAVRAQGATFVGPSSHALRLFGDKVQARKLALEQGLAQVPGTPEALNEADSEHVQRVAAELGFPLLVKAAAGGGGIGMQRADNLQELEAALATCRARSQAAFGDGRVYLERWVSRPRHIEVQVIADASGAARALGDRECSVQRRHQKVIEEAPAPAASLTPQVRAELYAQAERLIAAANYVGVATVEFLLDPSQPGTLYFLEVNARLQVEHPVTELISGLDLVEVQLALAAGETLRPEWSLPAPQGHAIEVRLYAEDPARNFAPQPGLLERLSLPAAAQLRLDSGYEAGDSVSSFYDPLIAKLIAHGPDRETARQRLAGGLAQLEVQLSGPKGPRVTNLEFLRRLLEAPAFVCGEYDTHLIAELTARA